MDQDLQRRSDEADVAKAEAEAAKARAEFEAAAAAARRQRLTALIPDFSKVEAGTLDVKEGPSPWSSYLLGSALSAAAEEAAGKLVARGGTSRRILVTSDPDLATSDAVSMDVVAGLKELCRAADAVIKPVSAPAEGKALDVAGSALDAVSAVATAVPAVLSLLAAKRTLSTTDLTPTDLAASAAVAGAMKQKSPTDTIVHDDFRLVPHTSVVSILLDQVAERRQELVGQKLALGNRKDVLEEQRAEVQADLDRLKKASPPDQAQIDAKTEELANLRRQLASADSLLGMIESLLAAIDAYLTTIRTPAGDRRSPLATAALHAQLHDGADPRFTHVLLVKAQSGQAQQEFEDRPLWWKDKFFIATDVSLTYLLIETNGSGIEAAGTHTALRTAHGDIGSKPTID